MRQTPDSPPLDRQQITAVALELLRQGGRKALSIRRLAEELGIKSASLYYHFRDKQQLLDYVATAMIQPAWRRPRDGERWQDWLIDTGHALRRQLSLYGDGALVAAGSTPTPEAYADAVSLLYAPLLEAGFSAEQTRNIVLTVLRFVGGWTFDEQIARERGGARPTPVNDAAFDFGIRTIIAGSELHLAAGSGAAGGAGQKG